MKRKTPASLVNSELFSENVFVISKEDPHRKEIETKIKGLGGKVADKISKNVC